MAGAKVNPRVIALGVAAVAILGVGAGLGAALGGGKGGSGGSPEPTPAPPPTAEQQASFTLAINTDEKSVLASASVQAPDQQGTAGAASAGETISVDWNTFNQVRPGAAIVNASTSGPPPNRFVMLLVREDGQWRLLTVEPQA